MESIVIINPLELERIIEKTIRKVLLENKKEVKPTDVYLKVSEASAFLRIPIETLYKYSAQRIIPFLKVGRNIKFKQSDLVQWMKTKEMKTKTEVIAQLNQL